MALDPNEERLVVTLAEGQQSLDRDDLIRYMDMGWNVHSTGTANNSFLGDSDVRKTYLFLRTKPDVGREAIA